MGVQFDRVMDEFEGPFVKSPRGELLKINGSVAASSKGYMLDARANQSFKVVNILLNSGEEVYRVASNEANNIGSFFIPVNSRSKAVIEKIVKESSAQFLSVSKRPSSLVKITKARIALWDMYGGSMASGWTRLIFEKFNYSFDVIYPKDIDTGNLKDKYDVIVFVGGAIPSVNSRSNFNSDRRTDSLIPMEFKAMTGRITAERSIPQLKLFMEQGGSVVTIGSSTQLAYHLKLPVTDAMVEIDSGAEKPLSREKFYTPGSILKVSVASNRMPAAGMQNEADVYFDNNPVFRLNPDAVSSGIIKPIAWFATDKPLRSGWAWGQVYLKNGVAAFEASVGKGRLYAFGPEINFRGQSHGTFKFLFNQLYKYQ